MRVERLITVSNKHGLHARTSSMLAQAAQRFSSEIWVCRLETGDRANAKSILELLTLGAAPGQRLQFEVEGDDSMAAMETIEALFLRRFGEED